MIILVQKEGIFLPPTICGSPEIFLKDFWWDHTNEFYGQTDPPEHVFNIFWSAEHHLVALRTLEFSKILKIGPFLGALGVL